MYVYTLFEHCRTAYNLFTNIKYINNQNEKLYFNLIFTYLIFIYT